MDTTPDRPLEPPYRREVPAWLLPRLVGCLSSPRRIDVSFSGPGTQMILPGNPDRSGFLVSSEFGVGVTLQLAPWPDPGSFGMVPQLSSGLYVVDLETYKGLVGYQWYALSTARIDLRVVEFINPYGG